MAVRRSHVACKLCGKPFWLRVQIGYEPVQRFAAPCPNCQSLIRGVVEPVDLETVRVTSEQFDEVPGGPDPTDRTVSYPTLNIAVDVPMFVDQVHGDPGPGLTPFLQLARYMPVMMLRATYPRLHPEWLKVNTLIEQLTESFLAGEDSQFDLQIRALASATTIELSNASRAVKLLEVYRVPLFSANNGEMYDALDQLRTIVRLIRGKPSALRTALVQALDVQSVDELRQKCWHSACRLVLNQGALSSAHYAEAVKTAGGPFDKLRSVRGDFETLAHAYLDGFEAASFALAFSAILENVAYRNDPGSSGSGAQVTLKKLLGLDARDREPLATGALQALFAPVSRIARNKIGHNAAHYDFRTGEIEFDNGIKLGLMELQCQLLAIYRLASWFCELAVVIEALAQGQDVDRRVTWEPTFTFEDHTVFLPRDDRGPRVTIRVKPPTESPSAEAKREPRKPESAKLVTRTRRVRASPMNERIYLPELSRPELTPEELVIYQALPSNQRSLDNVARVAGLIQGLANAFARRDPSDSEFADRLLDDPNFSLGYLEAFRHAQFTLGHKFTIVGVLTREDDRHVLSTFHTFPEGYSSSQAEPGLKKLYGDRLISIVAQHLGPESP